MNNRIQRKRTKGFKLPPGTICISRPSKWGNPFSEQTNPASTAAERVEMYRRWLLDDPDGWKILCDAKVELRGKTLACFCITDAVCHGDVLIELIEKAG